MKTKVKDDVPTVFIRDTIFGLAGSLSFITGLPKVGKTAIVAPLIATALKSDAKQVLQVRSEYCKGKMVVYVDTEQTESRTKKFRERVLRLAGIDLIKDCDYLETLSLLNYNQSQRVEIIKDIFNDLGEDLYMLIIDGLTDLLSGGVNDESGSNDIIQLLMKEAGRTGATIIPIIHENRGSNAARGHIGAEAERKCAGMLSIKKDSDRGVHEIRSKLIRYAGEFQPVLFRWDDIEKDFVELSPTETQESQTIDKEILKIQRLEKGVKQAFATNTELSKKTAIANLLLYCESKGKSTKTGERLLESAIGAGFLEMKDKETVKRNF